MRGHAFHPAGYISSHLKAAYHFEENSLVERCLNHLWKNVLPTLLILLCGSVITLFLSGLIAQAKSAHGTAAAGQPLVVEKSAGSKMP